MMRKMLVSLQPQEGERCFGGGRSSLPSYEAQAGAGRSVASTEGSAR
jgi:hypothetical protein